MDGYVDKQMDAMTRQQDREVYPTTLFFHIN